MAKRLCIASLLAACLAVCCSLLSGCLGLVATPKTAATVGSIIISEQEVTDYIEGFRSNDETRETDTGWAQYLSNTGYTAETLRTYVLNTVFIPQAVIKLQCEKRNLTVTDDELDSVIEREKNYYENRYGADSWDSVLASYGYDETTWRTNEENRLLEELLQNEVIDTVTPSSSQFSAYAKENASTYNGKHSYYASFSNEQAAQVAYVKLTKNNTEVTKSTFRRLTQVTNAGWSSIESDQELLSADYINTLNELDVKHVSKPLQLKEGEWVLIYCDKSFIADDNGKVKLSSIPSSIKDQLYSDVSEQLTEDAFEDWLSEVTKKTTVVIESMPQGLPYDVNVSIASEG